MSIRRRLVWLPIATLVLASAAFGSNIADYRSRIESAKNKIDGMSAMLESKETGAEVDQYIRTTANEIRRSLPETEKFDVEGGMVETSNKWLRAKLDQFEEGSGDRETILAEISERLSAIDERIGKLESDAAGGRTKDEDKQKLSEILRREEFQKPQEKEESLFQKLLRRFLEWLDSLFPKPKVPAAPLTGISGLSTVLQVVVYAVVIALIGFLVYKFAPLIASRIRKKEKADSGDRVILGERIEAGRSSGDLFSEAERMARDGDFRGAIRKGYVALLCDLSDRKIIGLARHKTNRDYLRDIRKRPSLFTTMKGLTGNFERHWYGFRAATSGDWEQFREEYRKTLNES